MHATKFIAMASCLMALIAANAFAGGKPETAGQDANGLGNWNYRIDVKDKPSGKYNIVIEGRDKAGNVGVAGPFNVYVDPQSDVPVVAVNNPVNGMRVGNNLNIVGTCVDDVAVDHVEIQLDAGDKITASGREFWSYYLPVKDIPDGPHTITVTGFDNHGTPSKPVAVAFNLDKFKPENAIDSHENGFLASGVVNLKGSAQDANGIAKFWVSLDDGSTFKEIGLDRPKDKPARFQFDFDTRRFPDGPKVVWLRSQDKTGSVGTAAFLLFIDNTKPSLSVLRPTAAEAVNGKTSLVGMASDVIGIKEMGWSLGKDGGPIKLMPGNPFFCQEIDFSAVRDKTAVVTIWAVDTIGNRSEIKYPVRVDPDADLPVVTLLNLKDKAVIDPNYSVALSIHDDDGVKAVHLFVDKRPEQTFPAAESALVPLENLETGPHVVVFQAEDSNGTLGKKVQVEVTVKGGAPELRFDTVKAGPSPTGYRPDPALGHMGPDADHPDGVPFRNGLRLLPDAVNKLAGSYRLGNPLKSAEYSLDGKTWQALPLKAGKNALEGGFEITLPANPAPGVLGVALRCKDNADQVVQVSGFVTIVDYRTVAALPAIETADQRLKDPAVALRDDAPFTVRLVGAQAESVRLQPPSAVAAAELRGNTVVVKPGREGVSPPLRIIVTTREKHEVASQELVFRSDFAPPSLQVASPVDGQRCKDSLPVALSAGDAGGLAQADWSFDGGKTWQELASFAGAKGNFNKSLPTDGIPEGAFTALFRVRDKAGNQSVSAVAAVKDATPPAIVLALPPRPNADKTPFWGTIADADALSVCEYQVDDGPWTPLALRKGGFAGVVENAGAAFSVKVRASDRSGNAAAAKQSLAAADAPAETPAAGDKGAKPRLRLLSPAEGLAWDGTQSLVVAVEGAAYQKASWSVDGQKTPVGLDFPASGVFSLKPETAGLKAGPLGLTLQLEGAAKTKDTLSLKINYDPNAGRPVVRLAGQSEAGAAFWAQGDDGVKALRYTVDGKNETTFDGDAGVFAAGADAAPGKHLLSVWAVDRDDKAGPKLDCPLTVSAAAPRLAFASAGEGVQPEAWTNGMDLTLGKAARLVLRVDGVSGVKDLAYSLNGQAAQKIAFKAKDASQSVDLPLPANLPWGRNIVTVSGSDGEGRPLLLEGGFYRVAATGSADAPPLENAVVLDRSRLDESGSARVSEGAPLQAYFVGLPLKSVALEPPSPDFQIDHDGQCISLASQKSAKADQRRIVATDANGDQWRSEPFNLLSDGAAPRIELADLADGQWLRDKLTLKGSVAKDIGTPVLEYAVGDQDYTALPLKPRGKGLFDFDATVDLAAIPDGTVLLSLRASDQSGGTTIVRRAFSKDATPPVLGLVAPPEGKTVNGTTTVVGSVVDAGRVKSVEFSSDYKTWAPVDLSDVYKTDIDFSKYGDKANQFWFRATDAAGNTASFNPSFNIDQNADKPVVQIQTPGEGEVIRNDFKVAGIAYDDDGIQAIYYRIDYKEAPAPKPAAAPPAARPGKPGSAAAPQPAAPKAAPASLRDQLSTFAKLDGKNSFAIPLSMLAVGDNEHTVEVVAEDIYGTLGDVGKRSFKISTAEPVSQIAEPATGTTIRQTVTMKGSAADANGIASVWLSFDNGSTFQQAVGTESWTYRLDTATLKDGNHVAIIKSIDKYGTEGLYTTLVTVDNTPPALTLDSPADGAELQGLLKLSGRISDNLKLRGVHLSLIPADSPVGSNRATLEQDLEPNTVLLQNIDCDKLAKGWYTLRIEARDMADNLNWISRDIKIVGKQQDDRLEINFPLEGETESGSFTVSGRVATAKALPANVTLSLNGQEIGTCPIGRNGYFNYTVDAGAIPDGAAKLVVRTELSGAEGGVKLESAERGFAYQATGYWIKLGQVQNGDFLTKRPFVKGSSGYYAPAVDKGSPDYAAYKAQIESHRVERVEISLDQGVTWQPIGGGGDWQYRVETQNFPNGDLHILARAVGRDGQLAVVRAVMVVDKEPPVIKVVKPTEEGRFNDHIDVEGVASDNFSLDSVKVLLRTGDKASYAVPSFIQGLYLDGHFLGATTWEIGVGLTFFDDNVKLQADFGQAPSGDRFDGYAMGAKLIANVAYIPFSWLFGPDWDFFSMSFAVGAQFDYFTMSGSAFNFDNPGVVLGSAIIQWEFARFHFSDWSVFRTIALYTEEQFWFISSDVQAGVSFKTTFGARVSIF